MQPANLLWHHAATYATREFVYGDRSFTAGEYVPCDEMGIDEFKKRSLVMANFLSVGPPPTRKR